MTGKPARSTRTTSSGKIRPYPVVYQLREHSTRSRTHHKYYEWRILARVPSLHTENEDESGYPARLRFRSADLVPAPVFELRLMVRKITKTNTSVRTTLVLDLLKGRPYRVFGIRANFARMCPNVGLNVFGSYSGQTFGLAVSHLSLPVAES
jgi:hypothetical protein